MRKAGGVENSGGSCDIELGGGVVNDDVEVDDEAGAAEFGEETACVERFGEADAVELG